MKKHHRKMRVVVFGVFDRLHEGHRAFLRAAKKHGGELIAVVARDEQVRLLKKRMPLHNEQIRMRALRQSKLADRVMLGDKKQGTYDVIRRHAPDIICLGYDQDALAVDLKTHMRDGILPYIRILRLRAYQPKKFKTSLMV